tara:strand:- start:54614 stop:55687 length:1074 start_codon:yes stop_codon:yes gene_type:complete
MQLDALKFSEEYKNYTNQQLDNKFLYLISGEEIYFLNKSKNLLLNYAKTKGFNQKITFYITNSFNWDEIFIEIQQQGLFAVNKLIDLQLEVKKIDNNIINNLNKLIANLNELIKKNINNNILIITYTGKIDAKNLKQAWYKNIKESGLIIAAGSLYINQFSAYIKRYSLEQNLKLSNDVLDYIIIKNHGNLLAATQEINKIKLLVANDTVIIDLEYLSNILENNGIYSVFDLGNSLLKGNYIESIRIFNNLADNGVQLVLILWIITKELRELHEIIYNASQSSISINKYITQNIKWQSKKVNTQDALNRIGVDDINLILNLASQIDQKIKSYDSLNFIKHQIEKLIYKICINNNQIK